MTKIAVFNPFRPSPPETTTVYLQLTQQTDCVLLTAVNERGTRQNNGNLMKFYPDGTFSRCAASEVDGRDFRSKG